MLSSQETSSRAAGDIVVRQTVGQQSANGNFRNSNAIVGQVFFKSETMKTAIAPVISITNVTHPNPYFDRLNFQFYSATAGLVKISLFYVMARLAYYKEKTAVNNFEYTVGIGAYPGSELIAEGLVGIKGSSFVVAGSYGIAQQLNKLKYKR